MKKLKEKISKLREKLSDADKTSFDEIDKANVAYPFTKECLKLEFLEQKGALSSAEYESLKNQYFKRNEYLYLFELTPAVFGQEVENIVLGYDTKNLKKASSETLKEAIQKEDFNKEFDLFHKLPDSNKIIRVEVKSCRAVTKSKAIGPLACRAARKSEFKRKLHFQQIKPGYCHIFVLAAVYCDDISLFVLNSSEIKGLDNLSTQHAGSPITDKNDSDFEGQVFLKYDEKNLGKYECKNKSVLFKIIKEKYDKLEEELKENINNKFNLKEKKKKTKPN